MPAKPVTASCLLALTILVVGGAGAPGCMSEAPNPHPFSPSPQQSIPVPPGARLIAYGHYPLSPFTPPREAGSLYVYDEDARKVAFITNYTEGNVNPTDLNQLSKNSFDPNHTYRVYYVPASAATATQPASVGQ